MPGGTTYNKCVGWGRLSRVQVNSEQVSLESGGKRTSSVNDVDGRRRGDQFKVIRAGPTGRGGGTTGVQVFYINLSEYTAHIIYLIHILIMNYFVSFIIYYKFFIDLSYSCRAPVPVTIKSFLLVCLAAELAAQLACASSV